jgi:LysR family glycine cleavage system transcriptional activator
MFDMPVNALRVFIAVYETGGVRPAARALKVAHSSVSRHLGELEKWIGVTLIEKRGGGRHLKLTPQGESLGRAGLASLKDLAAAVKSVQETPRRNTVVLSTTPSIASLWLLPRMPDAQKAYPSLELSIIVEQKIINPAEQAADLAIRMGKGPWKGLHCTPLMDDELFPVMSERFWRHHGEPSNPDDLQHLQLLHDRDPNTPWSVWLDAYCSVPIDTAAGPRFTSSDLVLRAAAQGMGVALARGRLAWEALAVGNLVRPFGDLHVGLPNAYWIVRPLGQARSSVRDVESWLKHQAELPRLVL